MRCGKGALRGKLRVVKMFETKNGGLIYGTKGSINSHKVPA